MKKYQQLRQKNYNAAVSITKTLKDRKFINRLDMMCLMQNLKGMPIGYDLPKNFETIFNFLFDHGIITKETINGFVVFAATQKCVRTKMENMFIEYQEITQDQVNAARDYAEINNNELSTEIEANVIGKNILKLNGKVLKDFVEDYIRIKGYILEYANAGPFSHYQKAEEFYTVNQVVQNIKEIKVVKV